MQLFDYEFIDNESLDIALELNDGKVLFLFHCMGFRILR